MCARRNPRPGAVAALVALLLLPVPAQAQVDPDAPAATYTAKAFDAVVLRPLGLVAAIVGAGLFPAAALVSAPGGRDALEQAWETFVKVPTKNVFQRPLGAF